MSDSSFTEDGLARWYDLINPWRPCDDFYLRLVLPAASVLDVGCGTGTLLKRARENGHTGRLCGLDPARAMLDQARTRSDVEWVLGDLTTVGWDQEFDLAVMTGHAFQVFVDDDEIRSSLAAIRAALADGGRFAFETRNPLARAWESWTPEHASEFTPEAGVTLRVEHNVVQVADGRVRFTETFTGPFWTEPQVSETTLRFLDTDSLATFLAEAGFTIDDQYGDWDGGPLTDTSREIITIARRA